MIIYLILAIYWRLWVQTNVLIACVNTVLINLCVWTPVVPRVAFFSPDCICHEVMGPDAMTLVFWISSFQPAVSLSCFTLFERLFRSSSLGWLLGSGDEQMKESDSWAYGEEDSRQRKPLVMGSMDGNQCSILEQRVEQKYHGRGMSLQRWVQAGPRKGF